MREELKRCSKCGNISLKSNFHKDKTKNDRLNSTCRVCRKISCNETLVRKLKFLFRKS